MRPDGFPQALLTGVFFAPFFLGLGVCEIGGSVFGGPMDEVPLTVTTTAFLDVAGESSKGSEGIRFSASSLVREHQCSSNSLVWWGSDRTHSLNLGL